MTPAREMIPVSRVQMRILGEKMTNGNCVRAYRSDPEGITLQIRMDGRFVSTWLPFADAKELAERILEEVNQ